MVFCQGIHARSPSGNRLKKDLRVQGHDIKYVYYAVTYILKQILVFSLPLEAVSHSVEWGQHPQMGQR